MTQQKTRWEDLHASVLMTDDDLVDALSVDPIFEMLWKPRAGSREELLSWMVGESFLVRHASGGGYITNLGAIAAARRLATFPSLERKAARVIIYEGVSKAKARQETEGVIGYALSFPRLLGFVPHEQTFVPGIGFARNHRKCSDTSGFLAYTRWGSSRHS